MNILNLNGNNIIPCISLLSSCNTCISDWYLQLHSKMWMKLIFWHFNYLHTNFSVNCYWGVFSMELAAQSRAMASSFLRFFEITYDTTVGRTPLDEWSARRRDLYLTTHDTHNRQTSMPPEGFEPTISAGERPQTYALLLKSNYMYAVWQYDTPRE